MPAERTRLFRGELVIQIFPEPTHDFRTIHSSILCRVMLPGSGVSLRTVADGARFLMPEGRRS
jgi:hypothetical protein